jgi:hypothetical protein
MTTGRIIVGILALLATVWHAVAVLRVEAQLEGLRRPDAPPLPGYAWGRFRYFSNPDNLRPEAAARARQYKGLWYGFVWIPVAWVALIPWLLAW